METARLIGSFTLIFFLSAQELLAQTLPLNVTGRAQAEMMKRIDEATKRYANQIGIQQSFIGYCQQELYLKTYTHPVNGYAAPTHMKPSHISET